MSLSIANYFLGFGGGQVNPAESRNFGMRMSGSRPSRSPGTWLNSLLPTLVLCRQFIPLLQRISLCSSSSLGFLHRSAHRGSGGWLAHTQIFSQSLFSFSLPLYCILESLGWRLFGVLLVTSAEEPSRRSQGCGSPGSGFISWSSSTVFLFLNLLN